MRSNPLRYLSLVALLCLSASSTHAAQVNGKLLTGAYRPAPEASPRAAYHWEIENGFKEVRPDRVDVKREIAVVLLGEGEPEGLDTVEIPIRGGSLLPSTVVVRKGATLHMRNEDEIAHEVYAKGLDGFSPEPTSPRARRSINLTKAGTWPLRDRLVSHARGHLHVLPDLVAVADVKSDGSFDFGDVAPGEYTLKVLHGGRELSSQKIEVGEDALPVPPLALSAEKDTE